MATSTKNFLSDMMRKAWMLVKTYGFTMSEAMRQSWQVCKLRKAMKTRIVKFLYTKQDGSVRTAWGTLKEDVAAPTMGVRKPSPTVQTYWDCEKESYRCFKIANFLRLAQ